MRKNYNFSNAVKNPHAGKFEEGYRIIVEHKGYDEVITITKAKKIKEDKNTILSAAATIPVINI